MFFNLRAFRFSAFLSGRTIDPGSRYAFLPTPAKIMSTKYCMFAKGFLGFLSSSKVVTHAWNTQRIARTAYPPSAKMERFARAPDRLGPMYIYRALSQMSGVDCGKSLKFVYVHDWLSTLIQLFRTNESTALKSACSRRIGSGSLCAESARP